MLKSAPLRGFILAVLVCALVVTGLRYFGIWGEEPQDAVIRYSTEALTALDAVRKRQPGDRRPASYDAVLAPLDTLLRLTRSEMTSPDFNPVRDYDKIRSMALPVMEIGALADQQAKKETGFLTKEYRFNDQVGEAGQYLALTLWEKMQAQLPPPPPGALSDELPTLPVSEMNELKRILTTSLAAAKDNRELWYLQGIVHRAEGLFPLAAKDLAAAVEADPDYADAWNVLGLVSISLKEFGHAEEALEKAKTLLQTQANTNKTPLGADYTAVIYNLAVFHEGLAVYYAREQRITPTLENKKLLDRHAAQARTYLEEFLNLEPSTSADAQAARSKLNSLPQ